ncbi:hypothetical protein TKK_0004840 [Trichogramma kaykai]|uniref:Ubiquitin-like domain-containing protein n=1 Tax=Trichogramma kaykai TaxID=54128 RepID=A0ABD2XKR3_9HYME
MADNNDNRCNADSQSELLLNSNAAAQTTNDDNNKKEDSPLRNILDNLLEAKTPEPDTREKVDFKVIFNKKKIDVSFALDGTVLELKSHLQNIISVPSTMQKIMIKGLAKDAQTLRELGVTKSAKVMVVGSKLDDVLQVSLPGKSGDAQGAKGESSESKAEPLSKQKLHRKILDKGKPEDAMPGLKGKQMSLPLEPMKGMLNKSGGKVRLTFKMEADQLWIGTKERTDKIPMNSIKDVISEPIHDHTEYHIMAIQLGPTEASRYWLYWVPAQYSQAIRDVILGKWYF